MAGRECYHCKQWVEEGEEHDCWTTTEVALTQDLSEDLRDAWERLRETAVSFGDQRIYASHKSIMFSRTSCYFFVRSKRSFLEVCIFLPRAVRCPQVRRSDRTSRTKVANMLRIHHRDEVEAPMTAWLEEAFPAVGAFGAHGAGGADEAKAFAQAATAAGTSPKISSEGQATTEEDEIASTCGRHAESRRRTAPRGRCAAVVTVA